MKTKYLLIGALVGLFWALPSHAQYTPPSGSSSSSGNPGPANRIDPTASPYNIKADGYVFADGTTTNTSPTFSSASINCNAATDVGKLLIAVNASTGAYPYGTGLVTVLSCNGNAWTLSANAGQSIAGTANWALGTDGGPGLVSAYQAAITTAYPGQGKQLALPCGIILVSVPPFQFTATNNNIWNYRPDITGCNNSTGTIFVLHPNVSAAVLANGGNIFYNQPGGGQIAGALQYNGNGGNQTVQHIQITGITGNIPGTAGKTYSVVNQNFGIVDDVSIFGFSVSAGTAILAQASAGEAKFSRLNFQSIGLGSAGAGNYTGVALTGQGVNAVSDSVFQSAGIRPAVSVTGGANSKISGLYCSLCGSGIVAAGGSTTIIGSSILISNASSGAAISDNGTATTLYVFGNPLLQEQIASFAPIQITNAATVMDLSGTNVVSATAGFNVTGTAQLNDRAGNTFSSALTQFTGKYVPIGGGSAATNTASAATNVGSVLTGVNVVAASPGTATYDVKIGFRQVTAGVGCSAGSNTVNGVLSWTAGGAAQATGSNGVPALGTLTISANGTVGTSSAYSSIPVHADVNTAISFTTTSTLASTGCGTVPQYVVDYSNI
jgi:hypothetical protein